MKKTKFNIYKTLGVQCILHTLCNLRCKFCFETKEKGIREDTVINIDYIDSLPDKIIPVILPGIDKYDIDVIKVTLMGGEMFADMIPDEVFEAYHRFARNMQLKLDEKVPGVKCHFQVVSNGVFTKYERVERFLKEFNSQLVISYDPVDRFTNDKQKEIWYNTFKHFTTPEFSAGLSTLLTKKSVAAFINGDPLFEKTGVNISVDSNIYVPRLDYEEYLLSDDDLFNFYKWALDNGKFNIADINNIMKHSPICNQGLFYIFKEDSSPNDTPNNLSDCLEGLPFPKKNYYGKNADHIKDDTDCIHCKQPLGLQKRGCLTCEYYLGCVEMCWTQILFDKYQITECPIKRVYEYIKQHPEIKEQYENWRKLYEVSWRRVYNKARC